MAATGAMLVGRSTYEVGKRMSDEDTDYDGGPVFVLTHQPPDEPEPGVTFLTCDLAEAVATARAVAGGKNLEILGADLASQCLQRGLVDEVWSMSYLCCSATACASQPRASAGSTWNRSATGSQVR
jgi:dihydrofolate reductase